MSAQKGPDGEGNTIVPHFPHRNYDFEVISRFLDSLPDNPPASGVPRYDNQQFDRMMKRVNQTTSAINHIALSPSDDTICYQAEEDTRTEDEAFLTNFFFEDDEEDDGWRPDDPEVSARTIQALTECVRDMFYDEIKKNWSEFSFELSEPYSYFEPHQMEDDEWTKVSENDRESSNSSLELD